MLHDAYDIEGTVIYPPANVEFFAEVADLEPREDRFVVLARFSVEKRLVSAIEALGRIMNTVPTARLSLVGATGSRSSAQALNELSRAMRQHDLAERVSIIKDADLTSVREILSRSKAIVSTMHDEPFGTAIVQGMAAGCVPIVHKSGGQYEDVLDHGKYGLTYEDDQELAEKIKTVLMDEKRRLQLKEQARTRASMFTTERFSSQMRERFAE